MSGFMAAGTKPASFHPVLRELWRRRRRGFRIHQVRREWEVHSDGSSRRRLENHGVRPVERHAGGRPRFTTRTATVFRTIPLRNPGLALVATNNRFRDGSYSNFNNTDLIGNAGCNEILPLFSWYVIESDTTRYKTTGIHVVYDAGGPADGSPDCGASGTAPCGSSSIGSILANTAELVSLPTPLRVPGARYCNLADCPTGDTGASGVLSTGRVDPPFWFGTEAWQGFSGENLFVEFAKKSFATNVNGGIHGEVIDASTRPFDDPGLLIHTSWTPDVPGVTVNLYQEGVASDGGTPPLHLVDTTKTSSWDDWAQGFYSSTPTAPGFNKPYMSCPGQLPAPTSTTAGDVFFFSLF